MQALRRATGTASSLLRCALQPNAVGAWRQAVAPLQLQGVRWMVATVNKGATIPLLQALEMVRSQAKAKFDESYGPHSSLCPRGTGSPASVAPTPCCAARVGPGILGACSTALAPALLVLFLTCVWCVPAAWTWSFRSTWTRASKTRRYVGWPCFPTVTPRSPRISPSLAALFRPLDIHRARAHGARARLG